MANVFLIDRIERRIVDRFLSENPKEKAEELAKGYFNDDEGSPKHIAIPTDKYPNRFGIETPTDFFIHYLI